LPGDAPFRRVGVALCAVTLCGGVARAAAPREAVSETRAAAVAAESEVRGAIVAAVRERVSDEAVVHVEALHVVLVPGAGPGILRATPEPGSRLGRLMRFTLSREAHAGLPVTGARRPRPTRAGEATATVRVVTRHARAALAIARGQELRESDVVLVVDDVGDGPLRRFPQDLQGARALCAIVSGAVLTGTVVAPAPLVRTGDEVRTRVRVGTMEAVGLTVAQQAGHLGDVIRVVNRSSRRALRGRVVGPREIEVIHAP
jgi:flagella basal body P-ring formation protein FlgA